MLSDNSLRNMREKKVATYLIQSSCIDGFKKSILNRCPGCQWTAFVVVPNKIAGFPQKGTQGLI